MRFAAALAMTAVALAVLQAPAYATDYVLTVSGPYDSFSSDSAWFDGTNTNELSPLFDVPNLNGGTFRATYRFNNDAAPHVTGSLATYSLGASAGMTFELLDPSGNVVHRGTNPSDAAASVIDNGVQGANVFDLVNLYGFVNSVSGLNLPAAIYSPPGELDALTSSIAFASGTAGGGFINSFALPTTAATYQSFPNAFFSTEMFFGDGDFVNGVDPFQYVDTIINYRITDVSVTEVPAPGVMAALALAGGLAVRRQRSR